MGQMMNPHFAIGFFSALTKEAYKVDDKTMNERLRVGSGPGWGLAGALTGMAVGRQLTRKLGPKAFWPKALLMAIPAALAAKLFHQVSGAGNAEQEIAAQALRGSDVGRSTTR